MAAPHLHVEIGGPAEELLTMEKVMELSKFSRQFIMKEIRKKNLNARKFGSVIRFKVSDYNAWLQKYFGDL